jgi:uncharacterized FlgJ-related protein
VQSVARSVKRERDKWVRRHSREKGELVAKKTAALKRSRRASTQLRRKLVERQETASRLAADVQRMQDTNERQRTQINELTHTAHQTRRQLTQSRYYRGTVADAKKELTREHSAAMQELERLHVEVEGWHAEYAKKRYRK